MAADRRNDASPWLDGWPEITDERVRAAFVRVPREAFVPDEYRKWAQRDMALPIGAGQTISQPFVVALMTQALALEPGTRVLEIGTGSGYQTAILCELTRVAREVPGACVWSVERHGDLAQQAGRVLAQLGYAPHLQLGDGAAGWPAAAPYDAIIVTAGATAVPLPLWHQLAEGGRMVIPVGMTPDEQMLWRLVKSGHEVVRQPLGPVRFVPLVSPILDNPSQVYRL